MFGWFHRSVTRYEFRDLQKLVNSLCIETSRALNELRRKDKEMANDLTKLKEAVTKLEEAVSSLPPDQQPAIDDLTTRVDAVTAKLAPPAPAP